MNVTVSAQSQDLLQDCNITSYKICTKYPVSAKKGLRSLLMALDICKALKVPVGITKASYTPKI